MTKPTEKQKKLHDYLQSLRFNPVAHESPRFPEFAAALKSADLVYGWDESRDIPVLFYGRELLEVSVAAGKSQQLRVAVVNYNQDIPDGDGNVSQANTKSLAFLVAAVMATKGSHDYKGNSEDMVIDCLPMPITFGQTRLSGLPN